MSVSKILNNNFTASWKTIPKCSICLTEFSSIKVIRNRAMILSCYHNVCEKCVYKNRNKTHLICSECNTRTEFIKSMPYRQICQMNYYLNGFLYYKDHILNVDIQKSNNSSNMDNEKSLNLKRHECSECNREYTQYFCIQCSVPYCITCFKRLHKSGKAFQKHNLSLLERDNNMFNNIKENQKCFHHKQILNKYCQTCKELICGNCVTSNHLNHITTSLRDENKKHFQQLNSLIETVKMARDTNRQAIKIELDFDRKYPSKNTILFSKWEDFVVKIKGLYKKLIKDNSSKLLLKILDNENCNNDSKNYILIILLNSILIPTIIKDDKIVWKPTIIDGQNGLAVFVNDTKFVENKYDQYCDEAIECVTSYFNKLHNILQLTESKVLMKIKENIVSSVGKVKQTQNTLEKTLKNFDDLVISLQKIADERPNSPLWNIIEKTNNILESAPCQVKYEIIENSPFIISKNENIENDLENCICIKRNNSNDLIGINLLTFFGDISQHLSDKSENINKIDISDNNKSGQEKFMMSLEMDKNPEKLTKKEKKNILAIKGLLNNSLDGQKNTKSNNSQIIHNKFVHVSHIKSPQEFYVQSEMFRLSWDEFHKTCKIEGEISTTPDYIEIDKIYLVYSNNKWYRGKILKRLKNINIYKVFLIDYGISLQILQQYIREISDDLLNRPHEATKCTLIGTKEKNENLTDAANILMTDIIANNQLIEMIILKEDNPCIVDLIVNDTFSTSISDALIFTDVVDKTDIDKNDKELNKNLLAYNEMKKKRIPLISKAFYNIVLPNTINNRIIPLNIESPDEFYVTKYDCKSDLEELSHDLNQTYSKSNKKIFLPRVNMPCAFCLKGKWCRAKILQVQSKLKCTIWLVDFGISEIAFWKQLRILDEKFLKSNEYSFKCSLMDIEPLQSDNYSWSSEAITEFKRCMKQSNLQIFVHNTKDFCHKVTLFIVKKTLDINVNALMVRYGFAISTGTESLLVEHPKLNNQNDELLSKCNLSIQQDNSPELTSNKLIKTSEDTPTPVLPVNEIRTNNSNEDTKSNQFRTKIRLTLIKSPGEFYINLEKHLDAISKLKKDIQTKQNKKLSENPESIINHNWKINENCLVYTKLTNNNDDNNKLQWYRGTIIDIDHNNDKYTVFLRDNGDTIDNIEVDKIAPIDPIFNRICNTTLKCHLACVLPTGGIDNWSYSSIDQLKYLTHKFHTIAATIQGERKNDSIPVILWGMTNEYADALAPNIYKWININKILVNNGFAHLNEKFDKNKQDLTYLDKEFDETEKQIKEMWVNVVDNISKVVENHTEIINKPQNHLIENTICMNFSDCSDELENVKSWLPAIPIDKSLFTAIPTYIDDNCCIYLHDACNEPVLDKIKKVINEKITNNEKICLSEKINWYIGQPCIARFHLDNLYYRGVIINIKENNIIQVCFVDYGNIEDCNTNDLITDLYLTKIPIQASKYELDGIVPNTENGKWSREVLDFIHSSIIMKMCSIRITDNSINDLIKKCSIQYENINIIKILIEHDYAIKVFDNDKLLQSESNKVLKKSVSKSNTIRQFLSSSEDDNLLENSDDEKDILIRATKPTTIDSVETRKDSEYYKKLFDKKELENLYTSLLLTKDDESDEEIIDMNCTFQSGDWKKNIDNFEESSNCENEAAIKLMLNTNDEKLTDKNDDKDSVSIESFNPKETSTVISRFDGFDNFPRSELPYGVKNFYCEIDYIRNATNFYIHPLLTEHEKIYYDMSRRIQIYAKTASPILEVLPKTPCLAIYNEDNLWYRAIIKTIHPKLDKVDVIYVDYLNCDTIPIINIRKCQEQLLMYPLRLMEVRLNGLKPNPRWRHSDIMRRLSAELLQHRKIYVKVIKEGKIPEIKFIESRSNSKLVLQELINERIYLLETDK